MPGRVARTLFSLTFFGLITWALPAEAKWKTYSPAEGFGFAMPAAPKESETTHKSFVGAVHEHTFTAKNGGVTYSFSYSELPGIAVSLGGIGTIYKKAKEGLLKESGGTETSFSPTSYSGFEGRELNFTPGSGGIGRARFYLVQKRLYVFVGSGPAGAAASIDRFLDSFKLQ